MYYSEDMNSEPARRFQLKLLKSASTEFNGGNGGEPRKVSSNEQLKGEDLISPRPLPNPVLESKERKELHRELLWNQKIGHQVLNNKTELQRVLQQRRIQQNRLHNVDPPLPEFIQVQKRIMNGTKN